MRLHLTKRIENRMIGEGPIINGELKIRAMQDQDNLNEMLSCVMANIQDPDLNGKSPDRFIKRLKDGYFGSYESCEIWIAEVAGVIAGELIAVPEEGGLHILSVGVKEEYRKRGIATSLLRKAFESAACHKLELVRIDVHGANEPAIKLYREMGFC